ncbi:MAG: hypothetical protein NTY26_12235, partial [Burkholderiales bacterium]|nr:hypothetical protein [Burkholderiales bacterium]
MVGVRRPVTSLGQRFETPASAGPGLSQQAQACDFLESGSKWFFPDLLIERVLRGLMSVYWCATDLE